MTELAAEAEDPGASGMVVELLRRVGHDAELLDVVGRYRWDGRPTTRRLK
ncbi:hypothetical protein [Streptomyces sp. NPDC048411]